MAAQWFVNFCGDELGPMTSAELRELAEVGGVQPDSLVRKGVDGNWVEARRVKGLFTAPEMRVASPPPPAPDWSTSLEPPVAPAPTLPQRERAPQPTATSNPPPLPKRRGPKFWGLGSFVIFLCFVVAVTCIYVEYKKRAINERSSEIVARLYSLDFNYRILRKEYEHNTEPNVLYPQPDLWMKKLEEIQAQMNEITKEKVFLLIELADIDPQEFDHQLQMIRLGRTPLGTKGD